MDSECSWVLNGGQGTGRLGEGFPREGGLCCMVRRSWGRSPEIRLDLLGTQVRSEQKIGLGQGKTYTGSSQKSLEECGRTLPHILPLVFSRPRGCWPQDCLTDPSLKPSSGPSSSSVWLWLWCLPLSPSVMATGSWLMAASLGCGNSAPPLTTLDLTVSET